MIFDFTRVYGILKLVKAKPPEYKTPKNKVSAEFQLRALNPSKTGKYVNSHTVKNSGAVWIGFEAKVNVNLDERNVFFA